MLKPVLRLWIAAMIFSKLISSAVAGELPGSWTQRSYSGPTGSRNYYLYLPKNNAGRGALPLMVMLHGCTQDAPGFAAITGMNQLAEKYGFAVVYPEQTAQNNVWKCWNWFKPENQTRDSGELAIVVGIVHEVQSATAIDSNQVYAAGLSAGAALSSSLIACYPDLFAGAGIHSGIEFEGASSDNEAFQVQANGASKDLGPSVADALRFAGSNVKLPAVIVIQGRADTTVNPKNADRVVRQRILINDLLDDGLANGSQSATPLTSESGQVPNGRSYTVTTYGGGGVAHLAQVRVDGMGHAWSGAYQSGQFADPQGPNASEMIWLFLSQHSLNR